MKDRLLIVIGAIGATLAVVCCATPLLAIVLGGVGLSAWLANAGYVVMPVLLAGVVIAGIGMRRRHVAAVTCCPPAFNEGPES